MTSSPLLIPTPTEIEWATVMYLDENDMLSSAAVAAYSGGALVWFSDRDLNDPYRLSLLCSARALSFLTSRPPL